MIILSARAIEISSLTVALNITHYALRITHYAIRNTQYGIRNRYKQGYETKSLRDKLGLKKSSAKLSNHFSAHCVDSWVLANSAVGGHASPDNRTENIISPLQWHRRQLYKLKTLKGGIRRPYGGTRSLGFKRGSLVKHLTKGICYVGGTSKGRISLHDLATGKRLTQRAKPEDCQFLSYCSWRFWR